ncbi:FAD/NAD-P-binding domain-containing protein [Mycena vulgaris]|nr:FAD/NAD-P-binding domain-containing protein [Mycena vulgaris]
MTTAKKDFRVAIVGGGVVGLACAVGLQRHGVDAEIFEAAAKFDAIGAGVALGPNALRALNRLGLLDTVQGLVDASNRDAHRCTVFLSGSGQHEIVHTPAFLAAVVPLVNPSAVHFNKRVAEISISASGAHLLHFTDGTTHETDVVIGADGIKSVARGAVLGAGRKALYYTNTAAYRGIIPTETLRLAGMKTDLGKNNYCVVGVNKHIVHFPIDSGRLINVVAFVTETSVPAGSVEITGPWMESPPQGEILDAFAHWGPDARILVEHLTSPSKWYIHALSPLETFVRGRIALVGDSAHAMPPHLGAGVGQGFEDAFVLCEVLAHRATNLSNIEAVFRAYDAVRRPRANMVLARSIRAGKIYEAYGKPGYEAVDMDGHLGDILEPIWTHDLDADVASAVAALQADGYF